MAKFAWQNKLSNQEREELLINFFKSLACVKSAKEAAQVLSDLLTEPELNMISKRLAVARDLLAGKSYFEISRDLKVARGTIARVNAWLNEAGEGFRLVAKRVETRKEKPAKDSIWVEEGTLTQFKRRHASYFWPEQILSQIIKSADAKQRSQLRAIVKKSRHKTKLLRQINSILLSG